MFFGGYASPTSWLFAQRSSARAPVLLVKENAEKAEQAYLAGARHLDHGELVAAQQSFASAATLNPERRDYTLALGLVREHRVRELIQQAARARLLHQIERSDSLLADARKLDPENELVLQHDQAELPEAKSSISRAKQLHEDVSFAGPILIAPNQETKDLHLRGDVRMVVTQTAATYGVKTVFDDSVIPQQLRLDLEQSAYAEAMPVLLRMAHLFAVPIDAKTLLVAKDSEENHAKFERMLEETVYVPGSTTEQLTELSNIVKNVFDVKQVAVSQSSGTLLLRAPAPTLKALNYTLTDLMDGGAEVLLEIKLLSLDKSRSLNTGVSPPTSAGAFSVAAEARQIVSANQSYVDQAIASGTYVPTGNASTDIIQEAVLLILSGVATDTKVSNLIAVAGHGQSLTGIYLGSGATLNFGLNLSEARALDDINVRVGNRQTAVLRVGSKYPITTSTFSSGLTGAAASLLSGRTINGQSASALAQQFVGAAATVPLIQYEDLGLTLKTTPTVLKSGLVTVHIDLKIESLTGASVNDIPVLTSRAFTSDLTVQDGVTAVMLSELSRTESASVNGTPGLAELPGFQQTLADKLRNVSTSELILLVTPHLVRRRPDLFAGPRIAFTPTVPQEN